jgi:hypothetical protein
MNALSPVGLTVRVRSPWKRPKASRRRVRRTFLRRVARSSGVVSKRERKGLGEEGAGAVDG